MQFWEFYPISGRIGQKNKPNIPPGRSVSWPRVGAASSAISGGEETPIFPCNAHGRQVFYFWSGHQRCGSLPEASVQFSWGWVGHVAPWAGINQHRAVGPDSRWQKVKQPNLIDKLAAWSHQTQQSGANLQMDGFDRSTCTMWGGMINLSDGILASAQIL